MILPLGGLVREVARTAAVKAGMRPKDFLNAILRENRGDNDKDEEEKEATPPRTTTAFVESVFEAESRWAITA